MTVWIGEKQHISVATLQKRLYKRASAIAIASEALSPYRVHNGSNGCDSTEYVNIHRNF